MLTIWNRILFIARKCYVLNKNIKSKCHVKDHVDVLKCLHLELMVVIKGYPCKRDQKIKLGNKLKGCDIYVCRYHWQNAARSLGVVTMSEELPRLRLLSATIISNSWWFDEIWGHRVAGQNFTNLFSAGLLGFLPSCIHRPGLNALHPRNSPTMTPHSCDDYRLSAQPIRNSKNPINFEEQSCMI
jgi:hypothetical protein